MRHRANSIDNFLGDRSLVMVHDQPQPCPYVSERQARMPLHWPTRGITPEELDQYMEAGYRRSGSFLYRTVCDGCRACEPTRIDVGQFALSRSMRRVMNRADRVVEMTVQTPCVDAQRVALLNRHRTQRDLALSGGVLDESDYRSFLVDTCCDTREFAYTMDGRLVAVATVDFGRRCLSAVYCYFDPELARLSLGTYSILKQFEVAAETGRQYVYLGMYVASNPHLNYKARFVPQARRIGSQWKFFTDHSKHTDD